MNSKMALPIGLVFLIAVNEARSDGLDSKTILATFNEEAIHERMLLPWDEIQALKDVLNRQMELCDSIYNFMERRNRPQLYVIRKKSEVILTLLNEEKALTLSTVRAYQDLIETYRYSTHFFKEIKSEKNVDWITELRKIATDLEAKWADKNDDVISKKTKLYFEKIDVLRRELLKTPNLPESLQASLQDKKFITALLDAIQKGELGDRPNAFKAGIAAAEKVKELYGQFGELTRNNSAFNITLEIMGITEIYREYAQVKEKEFVSEESPSLERDQKKEIQKNEK